MPAEAWAIFGVVVGAVLSGATQLVTDHVRSRREYRAEMRGAQRSVYVAFLGVTWRFAFEQSDDVVAAIRETAMECMAELELVAPQATYLAATDHLRAALAHPKHQDGTVVHEETDDELKARYFRTRKKVKRLAKRDLGLTFDETTLSRHRSTSLANADANDDSELGRTDADD